ncbi:MAG: DUF1385 domain-containing protein [Oscillospiraceae bacterium]|nr:DUF1385 domain-containing protein [Oscillospiraceae bacterium]
MGSKNTGKKTTVGGQALIEGVMMKGVSKGAMAVRMKDGSIDVDEWDIKPRKWYNKCPVIRGSINFVQQLGEGYKCLMKSAEKSGMLDDEEDEEPSKFEKWLDEKLGDKLTGAIMAIAMVIGVALAVFLFLLVPSYLFTWIESLLPTEPLGGLESVLPGLPAGSTVLVKSVDISMWRTTFEGVLKIIIFVVYMWATSKMKDMNRMYRYHGAEHKTIACYEAGKPLTVENVRPMCRFHPRCGTSFIIITLLVSILVYSVVPITPELFKSLLHLSSDSIAILLRTVCKLLLLPFVVGFAYELIRFAGRHDNIITKIFSAPGLWMQRITTKEPDDSMIEVAIAAVTPCLPKDGEDDNW